MSGRGIFPFGDLCCATEAAGDLGYAIKTGRDAPGCQRACFAESQSRQVRQSQWAMPRLIGMPTRTSLGDMANRIGALVAITRRVRRAADADGIENQNESPRHRSLGSSSADRQAQPFWAGVASDHCGTKIGKFLLNQRRAGVMRRNASMLRGEAKRQRHVEIGKCLHLPVEPTHGIRTKTIRPRKSCAQIADAKALEQSDALVEAMILEVKPLTNTERRRMARKARRCELWHAVLAEQTHVEVPVIGRALGFFVPGGGRPCARQIVETVPVNSRRAPDQQLGGTVEAPGLHFLGAEAGDADFRYPDRQAGDRFDLVDLLRPLADAP